LPQIKPVRSCCARSSSIRGGRRLRRRHLQGHGFLIAARGGPQSVVDRRRIVARAETCGDADDVFVDAKRHRVYVSCGEGVIDVLEPAEAGYRHLWRVPTVSGARTSLFVPELDRLFVAVRAQSKEPAAIWVFRPVP
jgi:hypothetical protein